MISIIIPSYNQQEYLPDAIESALNQTVKADEIIIVDDGSTDNSLEIAKKYPVKVVSQVNKGLASARNAGIMNAKGDYCLFLDADDMLLDNCVKRILEAIDKNSGLTNEGLMFGQPDIIAPSFKCFGLSQQEVILMPNPTIEDFKTANRIGYCSAIKRSALLEVGGYNPKMTWGAEDYDLWFDLLKRGKKLVTIPEVLWLYRIKEKSMWSETQKHQEEFMNQIKLNHPTIW